MRRLIFFLALIWATGLGFGQENVTPPKSNGPTAKLSRNLDALRSINAAIADVEVTLEAQREKMAQASPFSRPSGPAQCWFMSLPHNVNS